MKGVPIIGVGRGARLLRDSSQAQNDNRRLCRGSLRANRQSIAEQT